MEQNQPIQHIVQLQARIDWVLCLSLADSTNNSESREKLKFHLHQLKGVLLFQQQRNIAERLNRIEKKLNGHWLHHKSRTGIVSNELRLLHKQWCENIENPAGLPSQSTEIQVEETGESLCLDTLVKVIAGEYKRIAFEDGKTVQFQFDVEKYNLTYFQVQRLTLMLIHILRNSLDHSRRGHSDILKISIKSSLREDGYLIEVEDNGIGLGCSDLKSGEFSGSGLGLPSIERLIGELKGTYDLKQRPYGGTCSQIKLAC